MLQLWEHLGNLYGAKFLNQFGDVDGTGFQDWSLNLADLTPDQIHAGFLALTRTRRSYAPDSFEFKALCFDYSQYGLPSSDEAYLEAARARYPVTANHWSHPAVYHAGADTGWFELRSLPAAKIKAAFVKNYERRVGQVINGEILPTPRQEALERMAPPPVPREEARARCAQIKEYLEGNHD